MRESKKILIIDDKETIVNLLETVLSIYDYECLSSLEPKLGIKKAVEHKPDLIILDIAMPDMDGYEVCKVLKNDSRTRHIPILIITALSLIQDRRKALDCGADGFIFKPFDPQKVMSEIKRLIN